MVKWIVKCQFYKENIKEKIRRFLNAEVPGLSIRQVAVVAIVLVLAALIISWLSGNTSSILSKIWDAIRNWLSDITNNKFNISQ